MSEAMLIDQLLSKQIHILKTSREALPILPNNMAQAAVEAMPGEKPEVVAHTGKNEQEALPRKGQSHDILCEGL